MLLRASGEQKGQTFDFNTILGQGEGDGGIPEGRLMVDFAEAVVGDDDERLTRVRSALVEKLGAAALVDSAGIVATFNAIDRVADATGIPIDEERLAPTADLRDQLGINAFPSRAAE